MAACRLSSSLMRLPVADRLGLAVADTGDRTSSREQAQVAFPRRTKQTSAGTQCPT